MSKPQGKELIQRAILESVRGREFPRVTYASGTDLPTLSDTNLRPSRSTWCNETRSTFVEDTNHGCSYRRKRSNWQFNLLLDFDKEVSIEAWLNEISDTPLTVRDENGKLVGRVDLLSCGAVHPVAHNSAAGSKFSITFSVNNFNKY